MVPHCLYRPHHGVPNRPFTISDEVTARMPQVLVDHGLVQPPTEDEIEKAIKCLSSSKAPGADSIPAKIYVSDGPGLIERLKSLFLST